MADGPIIFAGLMPHAPVLVPGVGGGRLAEVESTANAMSVVAARAVAAKPDTLVLISPHSPRQPGAFGIWPAPRLRGSLAHFGSPDDQVDLPVDETFVDRLETEANHLGLNTWRIAQESLDHGAVVPLCYLTAAGWKGATVILSLNFPGDGGLDELGQAIAAAGRQLHRRTAVIASGDMSHRLTHSAPSGYHPDAHRFDEAFIALLRRGAVAEVARLDPELQELAAEDAADSTRVALAAAGYQPEGVKVLSYEGPFGVGYGVAVLFEPHPAPKADAAAGEGVALSRGEDLPEVARRAVEAYFTGRLKKPPGEAAGELASRRAVFVTVRTEKGALRGCIGSLAPTEKDLVRETWRFAAAAAFQDPRFAPVEATELPALRFSVTVLDEPEPAASPAELDPAVYGVVVTAADGRRGVLLPDIKGIDTVEEQLAIARRKAGIDPDEAVTLQRFKATSYKDPRPAAQEED